MQQELHLVIFMLTPLTICRWIVGRGFLDFEIRVANYFGISRIWTSIYFKMLMENDQSKRVWVQFLLGVVDNTSQLSQAHIIRFNWQYSR